MQYVTRFCSVCQSNVMVQVHNGGYVRCLAHEPLEPTAEQQKHNDDAYIARRVKK